MLRLLAVFVAGLLVATGIALAGVALALALVEIVPPWAATLIAAAAMLLAGALATAVALARSKREKSSAPVRPELLHALAGAMEKRPKTTLGLALLAGIALGIDPGLRRDLIALLREPLRE